MYSIQSLLTNIDGKDSDKMAVKILKYITVTNFEILYV